MSKLKKEENEQENIKNNDSIPAQQGGSVKSEDGQTVSPPSFEKAPAISPSQKRNAKCLSERPWTLKSLKK